MILLCTKIKLSEFLKTKLKHQVMRNHVMGNHISRGTTVLISYDFLIICFVRKRKDYRNF